MPVVVVGLAEIYGENGIVETRGCHLLARRADQTDATQSERIRNTFPLLLQPSTPTRFWSGGGAHRTSPAPGPASASDACAMPKEGAPRVISTEFFAAPAAAPRPRFYLSFFFGRICVVCPHFFFLQLTARGCRRA